MKGKMVAGSWFVYCNGGDNVPDSGNFWSWNCTGGFYSDK